MLDITARLADSWNGACNTADRYAPLREQVDAACLAARRDPASLERTIAVLIDYTDGRGIPTSFNPARLPPLSGSPAEIAGSLRELATAGVSEAIITTIPMTIESVEAFAPVLDLLDA
jgi:alkanesulfonate monooxygenase SsuD/methylene tetrahydromethanopterin reductase-like flavin-dependent oxidoreductase (luciferase family)